MTDPGAAPQPSAVHVPVLLEQVLHWLDPQPGHVIVDGTIGAAGHAAQIVRRIHPDGRLIGLDRDPMMLQLAQSLLGAKTSRLVHASYAELSRVLRELDITSVDGVLVDLGLSSDQLADPDRGFGFDSSGLDMRFDSTSGRPAMDLLNEASADQLADIFHEFGEERFARRIARRVVESRPIETAVQLAEVVRRAAPKGRRRERIHPATRVFQALRIAVNDELGALQQLLHRELPTALPPGGRAVVISFHSLEDRLVKRAFRDGPWDVLTRKPVVADAEEVKRNPRARSAKLRAARWLGAGAQSPHRGGETTPIRGNWRYTGPLEDA